MLFFMRVVSGLEAQDSIWIQSRFTGTRQRCFPIQHMVQRYFRFLPLLLSLCALLATSGFAPTAQATEVAPATPATAEKHEALSLKAVPLFTIGEFTVTNSMLVTWVVAAGIIVFAQMAMRKIQSVPGGAQNFWEWMVEGLYNFLESVIGAHLVKKTFWFFATIFIFILFLNWFGLIPGVGTIGWGHHDPVTNAFHVDRPLLRGANADLNLTFAMAVVFFALWLIWALQEVGFGGFFLHIFGPKGESTGFLRIMMIIVFFMVGWLEVVSIFFRPISLSFRLYGNVYAGENMLEAMAHLVPSLSWLIPIPFYFMEILVGIVQALVFMLLTAVFTLLIAHDPKAEGAHH